MTMIYSNPKRTNDEHALPDVEVFHHECADNLMEPCAEDCASGWYWRPEFPGCLPDGEPNGPFDTEQEAIEDAQSDADGNGEEEQIEAREFFEGRQFDEENS